MDNKLIEARISFSHLNSHDMIPHLLFYFKKLSWKIFEHNSHVAADTIDIFSPATASFLETYSEISVVKCNFKCAYTDDKFSIGALDKFNIRLPQKVSRKVLIEKTNNISDKKENFFSDKTNHFEIYSSLYPSERCIVIVDNFDFNSLF